MPRYFFHFIDHAEETIDGEGMDMPPDAVAAKALDVARHIMADDVKTGTLDLRARLDVHDDDGTLVFSQAFGDALRIITVD